MIDTREPVAHDGRHIVPSGRRNGMTAVALWTACASILMSSGAARVALAQENPYPGYVSAIYSDPAKWVCRPDKDDVCDHDMDATAVKANGRTKIEHWRQSRHPQFDCFYVYPTISIDATGNSDL